MKLFVLLLPGLCCICITSAANQFLLTKWENCEKDIPIKLDMDLSKTQGEANKLIFSGSIEITRDVHGPLELWIEVNKCDLDMKNCMKVPTQKFSGLCQKLRDKRSFYHHALETIHPPLECPFNVNNYTATNSTIDLMAISFLPLSDCLWVSTCKVFAGEGNKKELVLCTALEMMIKRVTSRKKN